MHFSYLLPNSISAKNKKKIIKNIVFDSLMVNLSQHTPHSTYPQIQKTRKRCDKFETTQKMLNFASQFRNEA